MKRKSGEWKKYADIERRERGKDERQVCWTDNQAIGKILKKMKGVKL